MAQLGGTFNPNDHEAPSFEPLPKGKYPVQIIESDYKPNKAGTGHNIELVAEVIDGQYKGRRVYQTLAYDNPSEIAVRIARGLITSICHAIGVTALNDTAQLHNRPFIAAIKIRKGKDGYDDSNEIQAASSIQEGGVATDPNQMFGDSQPAAQNTGYAGVQGGSYAQPSGWQNNQPAQTQSVQQQQQQPVQQQQANWSGQPQGQTTQPQTTQPQVTQNQPHVDNSAVPPMDFGNQQQGQQAQPQTTQPQGSQPQGQVQQSNEDLPPWI